MEKTVDCKCKSGCENRSCVCLKNNEPCDDDCKCVDCKNPLNGVDISKLSVCSIQNIDIYKDLTEEELNEKYELSCGCEEVPLRDLMGDYTCRKCGDVYWYSFCWDSAESDGHTWHCEICGQCRDWREWHCKKCNRCTYGVTLPCEHCGAPAKYDFKE